MARWFCFSLLFVMSTLKIAFCAIWHEICWLLTHFFFVPSLQSINILLSQSLAQCSFSFVLFSSISLYFRLDDCADIKSLFHSYFISLDSHVDSVHLDMFLYYSLSNTRLIIACYTTHIFFGVFFVCFIKWLGPFFFSKSVRIGHCLLLGLLHSCLFSPITIINWPFLLLLKMHSNISEREWMEKKRL